jgi:ferredoxin
MKKNDAALTRRKFMVATTAAATVPLLADLAVAKAAETKPAASAAAQPSCAAVAVPKLDKGTSLYFIGRGCVGCQTCRTLCPVKAIRLGDTGNEIDQSKCIHCGTCYDECPTCVITETKV